MITEQFDRNTVCLLSINFSHVKQMLQVCDTFKVKITKYFTKHRVSRYSGDSVEFPHFVFCIPRAKVSSWDDFKKLTIGYYDYDFNFKNMSFDFRPTINDLKARSRFGSDTYYGLCKYMKQRYLG